jgi:hypothetical protein
MKGKSRMKQVAGFALLLVVLPRLAAADPHAAWDSLVQRYVDDEGRVAYAQLKAESLAVLDGYVQTLQEAAPDELPEAEQIAFWLNAYNSRAVRGVLDSHNAEGLLSRKRFFSFYSFPVAGQRRTLDDIEHKILRRRFREPRIHFALVCASTSCPKLRREAYRGADLDRQLEAQARAFIDDPRRNRIAGGEVIRISAIFKWFAKDFEQSAGSVLDYLRRYRPISGSPRIEYLDYDWTLNAQPGQRP